MPLINTSLPNLIQGVSQQPDATRYAGQCEEQINALSSAVDGLTKRPNTRHIARLLQESDYDGESGAVETDTFVHFIDRDKSEKYVVIYDGTKLRIYNLSDGTQASITVGDTTYTDGYAISEEHYLYSFSPGRAIKAVTIADSTFLLNSSVTVAPTAEKTDAVEKKGFVYINRGDYDRKYTVKLATEGRDLPPAEAVISVQLERYETGVDDALTQHLIDTNVEGARNQWVGILLERNTDLTLPLTEHIVPTYAWRVSGVTIENAGLGYEAGTVPQIIISSNKSIYRDAVLTPNLAPDGSIASVSIEDVGHFQGVDFVGGVYDWLDAGYATGRVGRNTPTVSVEVRAVAPPLPTASVVGQTFADATFTSAAPSSSTGSSTGADSAVIAAGLLAELEDVPDIEDAFDFEHPSNSGAIIFTLKESLDDFKLTTTDGLSDTGIQAVYKEVDAMSSLPAKAPNNFKIKVRGDVELSEDDYYVKFTTTGGEDYGNGTWEETAGFEVTKGIDNSTLPALLVNNALNEFELREIETQERVAGDDETNPLPSFMGRRLSGLFFYKARLGFLSDDSVCTTESGLGLENDEGNMVYNFSRLTVTSLLDSAPIDVSVSHSRVTSLRDALAFQENLMLFSNNGQFVLKGSDLLTPKTVSITPVTNFDTSRNVSPISLGSYIYFPFERADFSGVREYALNASTDVYDSTEITEHVPHYIPKNIKAFAGSAAEDVMCVLSADEPGSLYVYKYFFSGQKKVLSSWFKFTFDGNIRGLEFIESTLYLVATDAGNTETNLLSIPFNAGLTDSAAVSHTTYLDMRVPAKVLAGTTAVKFPSYTAGAVKPLRASVSAYDQTTAPYRPENYALSVVTEDGASLPCINNTAGEVTLDTAVEADTLVWVGLGYTMSYTFSEQIFKATAGQGKSPSAATKTMVRNGSLYYNNTGHFDVKVTPEHRDTYTNTFSPTIVGASLLGTLNLESGFYRFPVLTGPQDTKITIENDTPLPSNFQSAEFESYVHARSSRYG